MSLLSCLKQCLIDVTPFRLSKLLYCRLFLICRTNNFGSLFTDRLDHKIYETKFPSAFFYCILFLLYRCNFSFRTQKPSFFVGCSHVITLPVSAFNCSIGKVDGNFTHKVSYRYYCHFPGLEAWRACLLTDEDTLKFSKQPISWKIVLDRMTDHVVIYEVEVLFFIVLSKAKITCLVGNQLVPPNV